MCQVVGSRVGERAVRGEEAHIEAGVRLGTFPEKVAWSKDVREADRLCTASQGAAGQAQTGLRSTVEGAGARDRSYRARGLLC